MRILVILFTLFVVIMTHELGHFAAMRAFDIDVKEVAIGFGPEFHRGTLGDGTEFTLRVLPFGGFTEPVQESIESAGIRQITLIYLAGMLANVVSGFLFFLCATTVWTDAGERAGITRPLRWSFSASLVQWLVFPFMFLWLMFLKPREFFRSVMGPVGILMGPPSDTSSEDEEHDDKETAVEEKKPPTPPLFGLLMFLGQFSVIIAGMNLLPFAPLDGGIMVASLIGEFISQDLALGFIAVSMSVFSVLILVVFLADFLRIIARLRGPKK